MTREQLENIWQVSRALRSAELRDCEVSSIHAGWTKDVREARIAAADARAAWRAAIDRAEVAAVKVTPDRLAVARAAAEWADGPLTHEDVEGLLEAMDAWPEPTAPEPLPAPTGPGWYWAWRINGGGWQVVNVIEVPLNASAFDAWIGPLIAPTAKGGAE